MAGKYAHNSEMHEKGELREAGGKDAVLAMLVVPMTNFVTDTTIICIIAVS